MNALIQAPYYWFSIVGAVGFSILFGAALPILFVRITREIRWLRPSRWAATFVLVWLLGLGIAWAFDSYCSAAGLFSYQPVILFCNFVFLASLTAVGFWKWRSLQRVVSHRELRHEQRIRGAMQEVTRSGHVTSHRSLQDPSKWIVESANRAACAALGYDYRTDFDNELVGLDAGSIVAPEGLHRAQEFAKEGSKAEYLVQLVCKPTRDQTGEWVQKRQWVEMSGMTLDEAGEIPLRLSCFNVVSEHIRRIEAQRDQLKIQRLMQDFAAQVERIKSYDLA